MSRHQARRTTWRDAARGVVGAVLLGIAVLVVGSAIAWIMTVVMT